MKRSFMTSKTRHNNKKNKMTQSTAIIREAVLADLPILKVFEQEIIEFERPFASNIKKDPITYYDLKELILQKDTHVLVAIIDEEIIGSGYAQIQNSKPYFKPEQFAYLGFMFVSPQHRGKGINGEITKKLIEWAKRRGILEIQLDVYAKNESATNAYKKIGFQPDLLKMRLQNEG
jgi:ribosomal protein S18 acetylase RimI-like enzyme